MKARVMVRLKDGVLDPQGKAVLHAAESLGCRGIEDVRVGKVFEVDMGKLDKAKARDILETLSSKLLANTVIENFEVEILE
jgi:phosphoribosylformylglycinamidine synthase